MVGNETQINVGNIEKILASDMDFMLKNSEEFKSELELRARHVAEYYANSTKWDGKTELPIPLDKLYEVLGEPFETKKGNVRRSLIAPIYQVLVNELRKRGLDISQHGVRLKSSRIFYVYLRRNNK